jgi:spoIIIJ-associated protein
MTDYNKIQEAQEIIQQVLFQMGFTQAKVDYEESITKGLIFNITMPDPFMLIGRQGSTLHSLQTICQALVSKKYFGQEPASPDAGQGGPLWFSLDVDDYKRKREWFLKETAKAAAEKAKLTGRGQALEPMPSFERRLVHAYLQENFPDVFSDSLGEDPYRQVVIRLKKPSA